MLRIPPPLARRSSKWGLIPLPWQSAKEANGGVATVAARIFNDASLRPRLCLEVRLLFPNSDSRVLPVPDFVPIQSYNSSARFKSRGQLSRGSTTQAAFPPDVVPGMPAIAKRKPRGARRRSESSSLLMDYSSPAGIQRHGRRLDDQAARQELAVRLRVNCGIEGRMNGRLERTVAKARAGRSYNDFPGDRPYDGIPQFQY